MKQRNNVIRWVVFALLLGWAIHSLVPTYNIFFSKDKEMIEKVKIKKELRNARNKKAKNLDLSVAEEKLLKTYSSDEAYSEITDEELKALEKYDNYQDKSLALGLDLQGGMHIVIEIDYKEMVDMLAKNKDSKFLSLLTEAEKRAGKNKEDFFKKVQEVFADSTVKLNRYFGKINQSDNEIVASFDSTAKRGVITSLQKLRNRIDRFGVAEPSIQKRGDYRIIVGLPGVKDEARAINTIKQTAFLEFKFVADEKDKSEVLSKLDTAMKQKYGYTSENKVDSKKEADKKEEKKKNSDAEDATKLFTKADADSTEAVVKTEEDILKERPFTGYLNLGYGGQVMVAAENKARIDEMLITDEARRVLGKFEFIWKAKSSFGMDNKEYYELFLVNKKVEMEGKHLKSANAMMSSGNTSTGGWEVVFELDNFGARRFSSLTGNNIGKRLAIILDGKLNSAPNISGRIPSGRGQITGSFGPQEAQDLANVLTSSLPAPIEVLEKRVVGPSLGSDSIRSGIMAAGAGIVLVIIFMVFFYKLSGVFSSIAVLLNLVFIMAALSYFGMTLTLPGIAGIILTIGMAVDANVLIFERIKEERKSKKSVLVAINAGYERAFHTIFDANITTLIAGVVLYQYGTGAIKGFALTLMIGILSGLYTSVVTTRLFTDLYVNKNSTKISI